MRDAGQDGTLKKELRPTPHPKIHFFLGASDLDETFRNGVSGYVDLAVKNSARNIKPIES